MSDEVQVQLEAVLAQLRPLEPVLTARVDAEQTELKRLQNEARGIEQRLAALAAQSVGLEARRAKAERERETLVLTRRDQTIASILSAITISMTVAMAAFWPALGLKGVIEQGLVAQFVAVGVGYGVGALLRRRASAR